MKKIKFDYKYAGIIAIILCLLLTITVRKVTIADGDMDKSSYGVFIGITDKDDYESIKGYDEIVIDAQNFTSGEVRKLKSQNKKVYSYLNIGSLENWRPYYNEFSSITLDSYENWPEEYWIDVSSTKWQEYVTSTLVPDLMAKGIDGFFIDNTDVYDNYPKTKIYTGLFNMLVQISETNLDVIINGGDRFVENLIENGRQNLITGVNQESVFSYIKDYTTPKFGEQSKETRKYYTDYLFKCHKSNLKIYMIEYTTDETVIRKAKYFVRRLDGKCYVSDSIGLRLPKTK
ncbi:endo alpha-1,4 polygalactosaminidase [Butyrivibrio sp. NC3005]|uniref:endo alpha-1,4 polygalactosaminidase n=1 Tax=Butyrivibrio sp. NC3005 TaxID=1280685 RepID=UPI0004262D46|nr:endo alpha-1,4 polygalactosaminidase [Butyrivibrio sp. NC3005]